QSERLDLSGLLEQEDRGASGRATRRVPGGRTLLSDDIVSGLDPARSGGWRRHGHNAEFPRDGQTCAKVSTRPAAAGHATAKRTLAGEEGDVQRARSAVRAGKRSAARKRWLHTVVR